MTYFLGRDVDVYVTLEATTASLAVGLNSAVSPASVASPRCSVITSGASGPASLVFANTMASDALVLASRVHDLTGVDLSISASDEDVGPFLGQVSTQSVELRKEMTITLTHKKSNEVWDGIYNGPSDGLWFEGRAPKGGDFNTTNTDATATFSAAGTANLRVGMFVDAVGVPRGTIIAEVTNSTTIEMSAAATATATNVDCACLDLPAFLHQGARFGVAYDGLNPLVSMGRSNPKSAVSGATYALHPNNAVNYGYRVHLRMKDAVEVYTVRNACITGHTVSLNADGTTEETLELKSYVLPVLYTGATNTFDKNLTTVGEM
jgi:hypothetical protein